MRKLAVLSFVTLDGVMQGPGSPDEDRSGGFSQGGWAVPFWADVMEQVQREAMSVPYEILFGRKTYETFAAYWPDAPRDGTSQMLNEARKYVVSSSLTALRWRNSHLLAGDAVGEIDRLKRTEGPLLQVHGSAELIQLLLKNDLIDEFRLWSFPLVLGQGKRLFETGCPPQNFELVKSEAGPGGVVMSILRKG